MKKQGFDNEKYLQMQSERIRERISQFGGKLYLEFGGKLFDDYHAARVLPGFQPDSKLRMLLQIKEQVEIVMAIGAADIEKNKVRSLRRASFQLWRSSHGSRPVASGGKSGAVSGTAEPGKRTFGSGFHEAGLDRCAHAGVLCDGGTYRGASSAGALWNRE